MVEYKGVCIWLETIEEVNSDSVKAEIKFTDPSTQKLPDDLSKGEIVIIKKEDIQTKLIDTPISS
ncbi:MAG: hypothetical protein WAX69_12790 [Victivallales bacterium]